MPDERPHRNVPAEFAVSERVHCNGAVPVVCGVCRCGPMRLYECRPGRRGRTRNGLLDAAKGDGYPHAPQHTDRAARRRPFARRVER